MSIWTTLSTRFTNEQINSPVHRPHYLAFGKIRRLASDLQEFRAEKAKPGTLSEKGLLEEVRAFAKKNTVPELRRHQHRAERAEQRLEARFQALFTPKIDPADLSSAMLRAEIRAHLRSLEPSARISVIMTGDDPRLMAAIFEAPEFLSGVSGEMREKAKALMIERANPNEVAAIEEERETVNLVNMAIELAVKMVREETGFKNSSSHEFDTWMTEASAAVEKELERVDGKAFAPDVDSIIAQAKAIPDFNEKFRVVDAILASSADDIDAKAA